MEVYYGLPDQRELFRLFGVMLKLKLWSNLQYKGILLSKTVDKTELLWSLQKYMHIRSKPKNFLFLLKSPIVNKKPLLA